MNKSIVIHNNNISLSKLSKDIKYLSFGLDRNENNKDVLNSDTDRYMTKFISKDIKNEGEFNLIFIKDRLSNNYLDFYGLILAYHLRFEKNSKYIPIVIISDLDSYTLNILTPLARILFTKNIYMIANNPDEINKMQNINYDTLLTEDNFKSDFLNLIDIEAPENSTSHNIANEWAIYRWAEFLKVENKAIQSNNNKIDSMLYFKYLLAKNPIKKDRAIGCKRVKNSGKILYIDDEWKSGWSDIFESYFDKSLDIDFNTFEYEFKDKNIFQVKNDIQKRVKEYNPDLVILDLRLIENDHKNINREDIGKYTGIQILEDIKNINQGIQVLMLTATSKSVILDKLYEYDILGYIKKEHPMDKNISTKENFDKLAKLVGKGLEKKYLKEIWDIQNTVLELSLLEEINFEIKSVFEILDSNMENKFIYAMFAIFKVMEIICNIYFEEKKIDAKWKAVWKDTNDTIDGYSTKDRLIAICKKLTLDNEIDQEISNISKIRNNTIHPKSMKDTLIDKDNIISWFNMLQTILKKIYKK